MIYQSMETVWIYRHFADLSTFCNCVDPCTLRRAWLYEGPEFTGFSSRSVQASIRSVQTSKGTSTPPQGASRPLRIASRPPQEHSDLYKEHPDLHKGVSRPRTNRDHVGHVKDASVRARSGHGCQRAYERSRVAKQFLSLLRLYARTSARSAFE